MFRLRFIFLFIFSSLVALFLAGCLPASQGDTAVSLVTATPVPVSTPTEPAREGVALTPQQVTEDFYAWYLETIGDRSDGSFTNPLVEGLYRDSDYLTADFIARIDETIANFEKGGYDPILLAQDIPERLDVQAPALDGGTATLVVLRYWGGNPDPSPMVVHLVQQDAVWRIDNVTPFEVPAAPDDTGAEEETGPLTPALDPAETVTAFYRAYLDYLGDDRLRTANNPLVDGFYRETGYLSPRLIQEVDAYVANYNPYGYDPLLMSLYFPEEFTVGQAEIDGATARVTLTRTWSVLDDALPMRALLVETDGRWFIDAVTFNLAPVGNPETDGPAQVVESFYAWYLAYGGSSAAGVFRNPLTDRAYADSPYLTPELVTAVDTNLAQMRAFELSGSDPFLCAQNIPISLFIERVYRPTAVASQGDRAMVLVRNGFWGLPSLVVGLAESADGWRIDQIDCAGRSLAHTVKAFYLWYLGAITDRSGAFQSPLANRAYRHHPLLAEAWVQKVDETLAGQTNGGFDPFLLAQDVPHGFSVMPGPAIDQALVTFYFVGPEGEPYNSWRVLVSGVEEGGRWAITGIRGDDLPEVQMFDSEEYGFSFAFPADWVLAELAQDGPGMPDDWPVAAGWQVMPAEIARELAAQTGPNPLAPPLVAPFQVDVVVGDETAVGRAFLPLDEAEIGSPGRHLAFIHNLEPGYSHTIFPHPTRHNTWIVITDWVTQFPGREAQGAGAMPVRDMMENSLQFRP